VDRHPSATVPSVELVGVFLGLLGIAAAIYIPLKIEALKRPKLRIEWAADANNLSMYGGPTRIAHIAVINEPIEGGSESGCCATRPRAVR
jgi:hypothetical protein